MSDMETLMQDPTRLYAIIGQQEARIRLLQEALVTMQARLEEPEEKPSVLKGGLNAK